MQWGSNRNLPDGQVVGSGGESTNMGGLECGYRCGQAERSREAPACEGGHAVGAGIGTRWSGGVPEVKGVDNPADGMTKNVAGKAMSKYLDILGLERRGGRADSGLVV